MVFLLLAILFGCAAAYGYYLDKQNEDFQNRWICTFRSALAGCSFSMLFCFVLWLFFKQAEANLGKTNGEARLPEIDGRARVDLPEGVTPSVEVPTRRVYKMMARHTASSVTSLNPDSIVWLRQRLGGRLFYRIGVSRGKKTDVLTLPAEQVFFVPGTPGEVVELGYWSYHTTWWGGQRLRQDSVHYQVSLSDRVTWLDFKEAAH